MERRSGAELFRLFHSKFDVRRSMFGVRLPESPMIPRPLHRWKSFWLGVFVLAFLAWAWVRSMSYVEGIFWMTGKHSINAGQAFGSVFLNWDGSRPPTTRPIFVWVQEVAPVGEPWLHKAVNVETYPRQLQLTVAHWFLILLVLLHWAAFLLWRGRRLRHLAIRP
jgi:hypothetical protein